MGQLGPNLEQFLSKIDFDKKMDFVKKKVDSPLAWGIEYTVSQCTDIPNFIFAIKQRGLEKTYKEYNSSTGLGSTNDLSWNSEKIMLKMSFLLHKSHFSERSFWTSNLDHL